MLGLRKEKVSGLWLFGNQRESKFLIQRPYTESSLPPAAQMFILWPDRSNASDAFVAHEEKDSVLGTQVSFTDQNDASELH